MNYETYSNSSKKRIKRLCGLVLLNKKIWYNELISLIPLKYWAKQNLFVLKKALLYTEDLLDNVEFIGKPVPLNTMKKHFEKVVEFI